MNELTWRSYQYEKKNNVGGILHIWSHLEDLGKRILSDNAVWGGKKVVRYLVVSIYLSMPSTNWYTPKPVGPWISFSLWMREVPVSQGQSKNDLFKYF